MKPASSPLQGHLSSSSSRENPQHAQRVLISSLLTRNILMSSASGGNTILFHVSWHKSLFLKRLRRIYLLKKQSFAFPSRSFLVIYFISLFYFMKRGAETMTMTGWRRNNPQRRKHTTTLTNRWLLRGYLHMNTLWQEMWLFKSTLLQEGELWQNRVARASSTPPQTKSRASRISLKPA